ncbi:MAG: M1 family metallopeptidase [Gemmatimonadales bacterium]
MNNAARYSILALLTLAAGTPNLEGQTESRRPIPYPVVPPADFRAAIEAGTRTPTGEPGPNYWQQWTDYTLRAKLLPEEKRLEGSARIVYHNRSPHTLPGLALHLLQNLDAEGAMRNRPAEEITGGIQLHRVAAAQQELTELTGPDQETGYGVDGTVLAIKLAQPVAPGDSIDVEIDWAFTIPQEGASGRMGWSRDNMFHIAYWYPQMAVLDDVVGWQTDEFLGNAEFYFGFGSYDVTIEAPQGWLVIATGELTNAEEVLTQQVVQRYRRAHDSDNVVHVITATDLENGTATNESDSGFLSWHFRSDTVRDVAFSATKESLWDAARTSVGDRDGDGSSDYALVSAIYRRDATNWDRAWRFAQHSIAFLSRWTGFPYPWPHMTAVEGNGLESGGMEYPMMTLIGGYNNRPASGLYGVIAHEFAHMWVPMVVGSDERRHSWMDEGTTSFNGGHASADFYPGNDPVEGNREGYLAVARRGLEGEIMRLSDYHYPGPAYGTASYSKPATMLNTLRALLGEEVFDHAYQEYIRTWSYKHPKPWDFFDWFNTAAGESLDWFWRAFYYETWTLDQAVGEVVQGDDGTTIVIEDRGWAPMPGRVRITRQNGDTLDREVPVSTWLTGATSAQLEVPAGSPVVRVEVDPDQLVPDIDRSNNVWDRGAR